MFDKPYYEDKKQKIVNRIIERKDKTISQIVGVLNDYLKENQSDTQELIDINQVLNESQSGETNAVENGSKEVSKDGEGEVRPDKSDSTEETK